MARYRILSLATTLTFSIAVASAEAQTYQLDSCVLQLARARQNETSVYKIEGETILTKYLNLLAEVYPEKVRSLKRIQIEVEDTSMEARSRTFSFRSNIEEGKIFTTTQTLQILQHIVIAEIISRISPELQGGWLQDYLLYMRRNPDKEPLVDPVLASGQIQLARHMVEEVRSDTIDELNSMLVFLLAHELGHFVAPSEPQQPGETESALSERHRAEETDADLFAIETLLKIEEKMKQGGPPTPYFLKGAPMLFLAWVVVYEGTNEREGAGTHPLHHMRYVSSFEEVFDNRHRLALSEADQARYRKLGEDMIGLFENLNSLDDDASKVTLESLRKFPLDQANVCSLLQTATR